MVRQEGKIVEWKFTIMQGFDTSNRLAYVPEGRTEKELIKLHRK